MCFFNEQPQGNKKKLARITVLLASNMNGSDKRKPLVIGKSQNPVCFKNAHKLPTLYKAQNAAWIDKKIFQEWILDFDNKMLGKKRKIYLLMDNCSSHKINTKLKIRF